MIHTATLKEAVLIAAPGALVWKNGETCLDLQSLVTLAEETDREPLGEGCFYVISREGAIGLADRYEYRTNWLWLPLQGEELVSALTELGAKRKALCDETDAVEPMPEEEKAAALAAAEPEVPVVEPPAAEPEIPVVEPPTADSPLFEAPPFMDAPPSFEPPVVNAPPVIEPPVMNEPPVIEAPVADPQPVPASANAASVCPSCGHAVSEGDRFCINCGSPIAPKPAPKPAPTNAFCMNCGGKLKPGDRFCMNCGTKV